MSESEVDKIIDEMSKKNGIPKDKIRAHYENWAVPLMQQGVIVKLEIGRWRAEKKIDFKEILFDIKIENSKFFNEYFELGKKHLFPMKINRFLNGIETKARKCLKDFSLKTVWGRFLPHTSFQSWQEENEKIKKEYFEAAKKVFDDYAEIKKEVLEEYSKYFDRFYAVYEDKMKSKSLTLESFKKQMMASIEKSILSSDEFYSSFYYDAFYFYIPIPSIIEKEKLETEKIKAEIEVVETEKKMRESLMKEYVEKKSKYIDQFVLATAGQIRETILETVKQIRDGIENNFNGRITPGIKNKILDMIGTMKFLDFYDDYEIRNVMDKLKIDLEKPKEFRWTGEILEGLKQIERNASAGIKSLLYGRFNQLEI